jgi:hypothetical protein
MAAQNRTIVYHEVAPADALFVASTRIISGVGVGSLVQC